MGLQPSASKTGLLLACQKPFDPELHLEPSEADEPALYGSGWHEVEAKLFRGALADSGRRYDQAIDVAARKWGVRGAAAELRSHVRSSYRYLLSWLKKEGWNLKTLKVETSYAIPTDAAPGASVRKIPPPTEDAHEYRGVGRGEIPGTLDLECEHTDGRQYLILDHKTGYMEEDHYTGDTFAEPARLPQMLTLGLVAPPKKRLTLAIFHADRAGMPNVHHDVADPKELARHRARLGIALSRIGEGALRPGPQCDHCPARTVCPAHTAQILSGVSRALVAAGVEKLATANSNSSKLTVEEQAARMYELFKRLDEMREGFRLGLRKLVKAGGVVELGDGKTLEISEEEYETLSKSSITRALGKIAGERLIASLRKKGVVEQGTRERLIPRAGR